ncbi:MAG: ProQ/FinO family protein [Pseudomonadota bacterium]|nr:ProQ/FinO family protein [Pseudomonadota bacterium]
MTDEPTPTGEQPSKAPPPRHPQKILPLLYERFPAAFPAPPAPPVPLKRGIRQDLEAALQGVLEAADVRCAIRFWVRSLPYRQAVAGGGQQLDLQGQPVEEVSEAHRAHAAIEIKHIRMKKAAAQQAHLAMPKAGKGKTKAKAAEGTRPPAPPAPPKPASPPPAAAAVRLSSGTQATVTVARRPTLKLKKKPSS